jgi:uncharacterized protein with ParB-like and HNH nuclease domain/predicted transport protein
MKANETKLLNFLQSSKQYVIPIYQRTYSWLESECDQLWQDILRAGRNDQQFVHFVGSVVHIEQDESTATLQAPKLVIDGQQRLTTVSLLLAALAAIVGDNEPVEGFSAKKIRNRYLTDPDEAGDKRYKLILTQTDRTSLCAIIDHAPRPHDYSVRVDSNYGFFKAKLSALGGNLSEVCRGLSKLMIVDVALTRGQDNPQLVFESLNSTGRELSQADLIRNYVLMSLEHDLQTRLYQQYWRPMEIEFGQDGYRDHFDNFMRHYLTVRTGEVPRIDQVYVAFKAYATRKQEEGVERLMGEILDYSRYFIRYVLGKESDPELAGAFRDLRDLRMGVEYPLILELYADFESGLLAKSDFCQIVRLIESYIFRRSVCEIPTNSLNKTFATFTRDLGKDQYLASAQVKFLSLPSYKRFPADEEFRRQLQIRNMYNIRNQSYWLRRMENFGRKERVAVEEYTIEHIMPQNEDMRSEWREMLGEDWQRIHATYLHTLGNLTLTGYNSEYSDRPFLEKRDMSGGFAHSPLRLNHGLGQLESWNESGIVKRAESLAELATQIWTYPQVDPATLSAIQPAIQTEHSEFTLDSYPQLMIASVKAVFDPLRSEVLALDPAVIEVCRSGYIAYKAETNFVDVEPQANRLKLYLNMPFHELNDPRGMAKDISGVGSLGNGDVALYLESPNDLPYTIGLIRQALNRQVGGEEQQ